MENITKENFMQHIAKTYEPYSRNNEKAFSAANDFQRKLGFKEFNNLIIRCNNALVKSIKYFQKNDIIYYGEPLSNPERLLMLACESYIYNLFGKSQSEFNQYLSKANKISDDLTKTIQFKIISKYKNNLYKIIKKNIDFKKYYNDIQYHVDNFLNIGEEITNFDPDKDLMKAMEVYLPILLNNLDISLNKIFKNEEEKYTYKYKFFHSNIVSISKGLIKLKKYDDVKKLCDLEMKIINNDYEKYKEKVLQLKK